MSCSHLHTVLLTSVATNIRIIEYLRLFALHRILEHASQKLNIRNAELHVQLSVQRLNLLIAARSLCSCIIECPTATATGHQTTSSTYCGLMLILTSSTYSPFVACTCARNTYVLLCSLQQFLISFESNQSALLSFESVEIRDVGFVTSLPASHRK